MPASSVYLTCLTMDPAKVKDNHQVHRVHRHHQRIVPYPKTTAKDLDSSIEIGVDKCAKVESSLSLISTSRIWASSILAKSSFTVIIIY